MTADLSASRERMKQMREAVNEIDDFISRNCQTIADSLEQALDNTVRIFFELQKVLDDEDEVDDFAEIRKIIRSTGGLLLEVDTEDAHPANQVRTQIEEEIKPAMQYGQIPYLWQVSVDDGSSWRVIFTLPVSEKFFEELVTKRVVELTEELAVAEVMLS